LKNMRSSMGRMTSHTWKINVMFETTSQYVYIPLGPSCRFFQGTSASCCLRWTHPSNKRPACSTEAAASPGSRFTVRDPWWGIRSHM
jgi:hypothetical protein